MPTGSVARFDIRRGYGFVVPDDGGEDVFVHQNNINMEGFRYLKPGEEVRYELEVGEKGMKAVDVQLLSERDPDEAPFRNDRDDYGGRDDYGRRDDYGGGRGRRDDYGDRRGRRDDYGDRRGGGQRGGRSNGNEERLQQEVERLRRKQERLMSLLVAKGVVDAGEVDGLAKAPVAASAADQDDSGDLETEY